MLHSNDQRSGWWGEVTIHLRLSEIKNKTFLSKVCGPGFPDSTLHEEAIDVSVTQVRVIVAFVYCTDY